MKKNQLIFILTIGILIGIFSCSKENEEQPQPETPVPVVKDPWEGVEGDIINYTTFNKERIAFGGGNNQSSIKTFTLHDEQRNVKSIKMYIILECPTGGCNAWDVYANIKVKDQSNDEFYEIRAISIRTNVFCEYIRTGKVQTIERRTSDTKCL